MTAADFRAAAQRMRRYRDLLPFLAAEFWLGLADWVEQTAVRHGYVTTVDLGVVVRVCPTCAANLGRWQWPCPDWTAAEAVVRAFLAGQP